VCHRVARGIVDNLVIEARNTGQDGAVFHDVKNF
jgi:hypothetical protein